MGLWLFLGLLALPILEIALFIIVGGAIGVLPTLALVVLAAVAGLAIVRAQGMQTLMRAQNEVEAGRDPSGPLAHGALKVLAGLLLIVPGFFTDAAGLILLVPSVRRALIGRGAALVTVRVAGYARSRAPRSPRPPETIDVDYEVVEDPGVRRGSSGWTRPHG